MRVTGKIRIYENESKKGDIYYSTRFSSNSGTKDEPKYNNLYAFIGGSKDTLKKLAQLNDDFIKNNKDAESEFWFEVDVKDAFMTFEYAEEKGAFKNFKLVIMDVDAIEKIDKPRKRA